MALMIDRKQLAEAIDKLKFFSDGERAALLATVYSVPAVDAVEVVRCKDCRQWRRNNGFADSPNGHCFYHCIEMNGNDFCSYGERGK